MEITPQAAPRRRPANEERWKNSGQSSSSGMPLGAADGRGKIETHTDRERDEADSERRWEETDWSVTLRGDGYIRSGEWERRCRGQRSAHTSDRTAW